MKVLLIFVLLALVACSGDRLEENIDLSSHETVNSLTHEKDFITIGEKVDGPANVRDKPNGEVVFELYDNAIIQVANDTGDWVRIGIYCSTNKEQQNNSVMEVNAILYDNNHKAFGKMHKDFIALIMDESSDDGYAYLEGYTHRDNIRPESVIEKDLVSFIGQNGRDKSVFQTFVDKYQMQRDSAHLDFESFFIYENWITDPSPGYRVSLLFIDSQLQGVMHSREVNLSNTTKYDLGTFRYQVSFFNDYPNDEQLQFVEYMTDWLQGVD